ncbi:hypothetical protein DSM112329_01072 [Paraconexibacter sp. AEG42_29]|uniref:Diguanylate cyclase n=1 Tax=Paraconexibacter sp. AEG42_29 TaxID=2997339 RepID=A0AAU7ARX0_9ACTN
MLPRQLSPGRLAGLTLLVAALYVAGAQLAFHAAVVSGTACPVWPATAIALVATIRFGTAALPGIVIGCVVANGSRPIPALAVALIIAGNVLEPLIAVTILRRRRVDTGFGAPQDVVVFAGAVCVGAAASALGGVGGLLLTGVVASADALPTAGLWWLGNVCGALCTAPLVLVRRERGHASRTEELLVPAAAAGIGTVVLGTPDTQVYAVFPILIWAGLRLGPRGAAGVALILSALTVGHAARGNGPFVQDTVTSSLLTSQGFILVTALTTLLLASITGERRRAGLRLARSEQAKRALADEQAALRRVAEAAARNIAAEPTFALAAREIAELLDLDLGVVVHFRDEHTVLVHGEFGRLSRPGRANAVMPIEPGGLAAQVRVGRTTRHDEREVPAPSLLPFLQRVGAPVVVADEVWGAVIVATTSRTTLPADTEERVERFAGLVSLAVANAQSRERLTAQATTDPLTGLLNHRAFHERLHEEVERAERHGRALAVAVFDIDHFKAVNDAHGHAAGDRVLAEAARCLRATARHGEPVGRVGGDELAVIMPEVDGLGAFAAADRMRRSIVHGDFGDLGPITASAGTCDLALGASAEGLLRLADGALYWAKAHGRNVAFRYTPEIVEELSAAERADRLARSQALSGVRALARAIDAKDPSTTLHSERVAELAVRLAQVAGWTPARVALLREAALVHDVGKIGVPDAVLFKRGRLSAAEMALVRRHADLGAQIASEVLGAEQAAWVRGHHERHDGRGYPDGLRAGGVPAGARLLALADAWDAMTRARVYRAPMPPELAWAEVRGQRGRQFDPAAVDLLGELWAAGELDDVPVAAVALR